ncbi:GGDEF domain-containing protein [Shewanella sp. SNU WT4]|uniref:sensor domain-containing diguanylate cyclase n=1 Tax=Shewanella sp. SNU WT4 TaxID=2590015 RepID=UPI00112C2512|nr:sensor domain-containing diguanylate cyclase [Shewanella sp. SNU WT4]QDF67808.1 GGDEF domain-containing protein [Shewanella sp. SNU WT4]
MSAFKIKHSKVHSKHKYAIFFLLALPLIYLCVWLYLNKTQVAIGQHILLFVGLYTLCILGAQFLYRLHINQMWQHLERVLHINQVTAELTLTAHDFNNETEFFSSLLDQAIKLIPAAQMGSIIKINQETQECEFLCARHMDLQALQSIRFSILQTFTYQLTAGKCDQVVSIDDITKFNSNNALSEQQCHILHNSCEVPIKATLSAPIYVNNTFYAMLNLDSPRAGAFGNFDRNLVAILSREASYALTSYQQAQQINALANSDGLTGLINRQRFDKLIHQQTAGQLLVIDLDNLKQINDQLGHTVGDDVIKAFANNLRHAFSETALIARFGGDEFVVFEPGNSAKLALSLQALSTMCQQHQPVIGYSVGQSHYQGDFDCSFAEADQAMYQQKKAKSKALSPMVMHSKSINSMPINSESINSEPMPSPAVDIDKANTAQHAG